MIPTLSDLRNWLRNAPIVALVAASVALAAAFPVAPAGQRAK